MTKLSPSLVLLVFGMTLGACNNDARHASKGSEKPERLTVEAPTRRAPEEGAPASTRDDPGEANVPAKQARKELADAAKKARIELEKAAKRAKKRLEEAKREAESVASSQQK